MNKDLMRDIFLNLGFEEDDIRRDGYESDTLRNTPSFNRAIAEYKVDLVEKEDAVTKDPTLDPKLRDSYREYYSLLRLLLDGLVGTLDAKIKRLENLSAAEEEPQRERGRKKTS